MELCHVTCGVMKLCHVTVRCGVILELHHVRCGMITWTCVIPGVECYLELCHECQVLIDQRCSVHSYCGC